ncbi:MAG: alpha/beta hydrolase [Anaerolineae bacterium]
MWQPYNALFPQNTVVGDLYIQKDVFSPQLNNRRDVLVWVPSSYHTSERRYPVIYMHDGLNLFDANTSYSGEWQVDEAITALAADGLEAVVVGLPNMGDERFHEYNPYPTARVEGRGAAYIAFITDTIKPMIDADYRTLPDAAHTGIAGSSMGGLISLFGFLSRQDVFGLCGSFSPVFWLGDGEGGLYQTIADAATGQGRVYLDIGTQEGAVLTGLPPERSKPTETPHDTYTLGVRKLGEDLLARGYVAGQTLLYVEEEGALHNEAAWARRLPEALRFLLK